MAGDVRWIVNGESRQNPLDRTNHLARVVAGLLSGPLAMLPALLFFLAMTSLVALSQHLTILWVAMEATTLATAVLLYFNQNRSSLEATWKYLMIGSVGIALALLGTLFLAYGARLGALYSVSDVAPQFEYGIREEG